MIFVSQKNGSVAFQTVDGAMEFVQEVVQKKDDIWVSGDEEYPCLAVCTNAPYAAVHFIQSDGGEVWLSYNENNQREVDFLVDDVKWCPTADAVVSLDDAIACVKEFLTTYKKPSCIQWQEL